MSEARPFIALGAMAYKRRSGASKARTGDGQPNDSADAPSSDLPEGALSISGRVLNEDGQGLNGIEVIGRLNRQFESGQAPAPNGVGGERRAHSGPDGSFAFEQLAGGEYQLTTAATERYPSTAVVVRSGTDNARLVLRETRRPLVVYGQIKNRDGEPLAGVQVIPSTQPREAAFSDQSGDYRLNLTLGRKDKTVTLRLRLANFKEQTLRLDRIDFQGVEARQLDAVMEPIGSLAIVSGRVLTSDGEPVFNETLVLYSPSIARHYHATSDASGSFAIKDVPASDDYRLSIQPRGPFQDYFKDRLRVPADGLTLEVELKRLALSALSGRMVDVQGNPIPNFSLWLRSVTVAQLQPVEVTSNAGGYFRVGEIPQGEVILQTMSSPFISVKGLRLPPGEELHADLVLDWGTFRLQGRVVDQTGKPVPAPEIQLSWSHQENGANSLSIRRTAAAADGRFQFDRLGPGLHTFGVDIPGFKNFTLRHEVGGASSGPVELRLEESAP